MKLDYTRLRSGEWLLAAASLLLLIAMALPWYGLNGPLAVGAAQLGAASKGNGWQVLGLLRFLIPITCVVGIFTTYAQASRATPALPVCLTVITFVLSFVTMIALIIKVVVSHPAAHSDIGQRFGAWSGLVFAILLPIGAYWSLRTDGIREEDGPQEIESFKLVQQVEAGVR